MSPVFRAGLCWMVLASGLHAAAGPFVETDGLVVIEAESCPPPKGWVLEKTQTGFTGEGYYVWRGGDRYGGASGEPLKYQILIYQPGTYQFRMRNYHNHPRSDLANDIWVRMDGGRWVKSFSSTQREWTWATRFEPAHGKFAEPEFELEAGWHTLEISGRSNDFSLDRLHLFRAGAAGAADPQRPESVEFPPLAIEGCPPAWMTLWQSGRLGSLLNAVRGNPESPAAGAVEKHVTAHVEKRRSQILAAKEQDLVGAADLLGMLAKQLSGTDLQKQFDEEARAWRRDPAAQNELAARKMLEVLESRAADLRSKGDPGDARFRQRQAGALNQLADGVRVMREKYPGSRASTKALKLAEEFRLTPAGAAGFSR